MKISHSKESWDAHGKQIKLWVETVFLSHKTEKMSFRKTKRKEKEDMIK